MNLIQLYAELSALTREVCKTCSPPYRCCSEIGCGKTKFWARNVYGIYLEETKGPLPYLTDTGCTVAPHMRPVCSFHLCPDKEPPPGYQELKMKIIEEEAKRFGEIIASKPGKVL